MRKVVSLTLLIIMVFSATASFASFDEKISNHWSKAYVEKDFVAYYFPYLAKDDFERFDPAAVLDEKDFTLSLASLSMDYDIEVTYDDIGISKKLTRSEAVSIIGRKLLEDPAIQYEEKQIPFQDINTMDEESIELLRVLYSLGIINGVSATSFAPDKLLTQSEAIIILQRLKGVWEGMREVVFDIKGIIQSYNSQETVIVKEEGDKVLVTITKEFPTPGYSMDVRRILRGSKGYKIQLDISPPKADAILPQVITYKTMTVEIDKEELGQGPPYVFVVEDKRQSIR
ncbi:MAG: S-layer homology domain-containing protein [Tissierellia bacterium]|nr:S-layer homology domain-containing protein [Tissierellia bacterium]